MINLSKRKLIFVYNADSGPINFVKDFWHKLLKPSTYKCNLCAQTFGTFGIKKDWKSFIKNLGMEAEFLHKNEFEKKFGLDDAEYPSAYVLNNDALNLLITRDEMNSAKSLDEMEALVLNKINTIRD